MFCPCKILLLAVFLTNFGSNEAFAGRYLKDLVPYAKLEKDGRLSIFDKSCSFPCFEQDKETVTIDMPLLTCPEQLEADQELARLNTVNPCNQDGYLLCTYCVNKKIKIATLYKYCQMQPNAKCDMSKNVTSAKEHVECHDCVTTVSIHASTEL